MKPNSYSAATTPDWLRDWQTLEDAAFTGLEPLPGFRSAPQLPAVEMSNPAASPPGGLVALADHLPRYNLEDVLRELSYDSLKGMALSLLHGRSDRTKRRFQKTELLNEALRRISGDFHPARGWTDLRQFNIYLWNAVKWTLKDNHRTAAHQNQMRTDFTEDLRHPAAEGDFSEDYLDKIFSDEMDFSTVQSRSIAVDILEQFRERDPLGFDLLLNYKGHDFSLGQIVQQHGQNPPWQKAKKLKPAKPDPTKPPKEVQNPQKAAEKMLGRYLVELRLALRAEGRRRGLKLKG